MAKTKEDYVRLAKEHLDKAREELKSSHKRTLPKGYFESGEFEKAAEDYARAGMRNEAYRCLEKAEGYELKAQEKIHPGWNKHIKKAQKGERKKIERLLNEAEGTGLVGKIVKALGLGIFVIMGLYFLSSNTITGNVVTNLNGIGSGFLINFILVGILGLVCYSYLK